MTTQTIAAGADTPAAADTGNYAAVTAFISIPSISPSGPSVNRKEAARELLSLLWAGGAGGYWWTSDGPEYSDPATGDTKQRKESLWFPTTRPAPIPAHWRARNVYFGVHPSGELRRPWERSTIGSIAAVNCVFGEFDAKDYGSKDAIMTHLDGLPVYPSAIVDSGGGYHCYWLLSRTTAVDDRNRRDLVMLQRAWVTLVGSDEAAKDLARVLRVPGTFNFKYAPPRPVTLIEFRSMRRFDLAHVRMLAGHHLAQLMNEDERRIDADARRTADVAPGAANKLLQWAVTNVRPGGRHNMGLWLCGRLKDENIEPWVADAVLRDYMKRVGDNPERDAKQAGAIVRHIYEGRGAA